MAVYHLCTVAPRGFLLPMSECRVRNGDVRCEDRVLSHISLTKRSDGWLIAVDGAELLVCARRKAALRAIRDAIARDLPSISEADGLAAATHVDETHTDETHADEMHADQAHDASRQLTSQQVASALLHDIAGEVGDHLDESCPHRRQRAQRAV